mgnify:CR=1 FL=1
MGQPDSQIKLLSDILINQKENKEQHEELLLVFDEVQQKLIKSDQFKELIFKRTSLKS